MAPGPAGRIQGGWSLMAVTLIGNDGLFKRLGKLFWVVEKIIELQTDNPGGIKEEMEDILDEFSSADVFMLAGLDTQILTTQINIGTPILGVLRRAAEKIVIEMVNADTNKLPDRTFRTAVLELIDQMDNTADDVLVNGSITSTPTAKGANTGNGVIITAVTKPMGPGAGDEWQNARQERIEVKCTVDAQERGTEGRESFVARAEPSISDIRHPDWPDKATASQGAGSGVTVGIRVTDPEENAQSGIARNLLHNSGFETFTVTNKPDNWVLNTGVVTTDIFEEGTVVYRGSKSLELLGDGSLQHDLSQTLNTSGQTTGKIKPERKYLCFFRMSTVAAVSGTIRISVKDGSDSILDSGDAALATDLTGVSTGGTFDLLSFSFNSPLDQPSTVKLVIEATTAVSNGHRVYIDDLCLCEMVQVGGPSGTYMIITPGSTAFIRDDIIHVAIVNDHVGTMQQHFDRMFGMASMGIQLPVDGAPTILENLIV